MQVREYVLQRDGLVCQYCGKAGGKLETDHVIPQSKNGPYRISHLATSCRDCNQRKDNRSLDEFLKDDPARLRRIRAQVRKSLNSATHMNQLMPLLLGALAEQGIPVEESDAVSTAYTRRVLGVEKTHANDAACLGDPGKLMNVPREVTVVRLSDTAGGRCSFHRAGMALPGTRPDPREGTAPTGPTAGWQGRYRG